MKTNLSKLITTLFAMQLLTLFSSPAAHAQGSIANGETRTGAIVFTNQVDSWTFSANAGDAIIVRVGEVNTALAFTPKIQLLSPSSAILATSSGTSAAEVTNRAASSGTYTILVSDNAGTQTNSYRLTLAKSGTTATPSPGHAGGAITNGYTNVGFLDVGELGVWSFNAAKGDAIVVRMGPTNTAYVAGNLTGWVRVFGPDGAQLGASIAYGQYAGNSADVQTQATTNGVVTVVVGTAGTGLNGTGGYRVTLGKSGEVATPALGDTGGLLTNGVTYVGDLPGGDLDVWSFNAAKGDAIVVRMGPTNTAYVAGNLTGWVRVFGPDGAQLGASIAYGQYAGNSADVQTQATTNGVVTVVVGTAGTGLNGTGGYRVTLGKVPGAFVVLSDDDGGPLANNLSQNATNVVAELDMWSFCADAGRSIFVQVTKLANLSGTYTPQIRLFGPDGTWLGTAANSSVATISRTATNSGKYTVVVGDGTSALNAAGTYQLLATGIHTCASVVLDCALSPQLSTNVVGTSHTVTDYVTTNLNPAVGALVNFSVISGPNIGQSGSTNTAANGEAVFTYTGNSTPGTDIIRAIASITGASVTCTATRVWTALPPEAAFSASPTEGAAPLLVNFTDASAGTITNRLWNFGDTGTSTAASPSHTYSNAGVYSASLTVFGPGGSSMTNAVNLITVTNVVPVASLTANPTNGAAPLLVFFNDTSTGTITNRLWSFGDGATSGGTAPTHTYSTAGVYSVSLTVFGPGGSDTLNRPGLVTVTNIAPMAGFTASPTNGFASLQVNFTDTSTGTITNRLWDFGDGGTSTANNPSHTYTNAGSYSVTLTVFGPTGNDSITKPQLIEVTTPPVTADLELSKIGLPSPVFIASNLTYTITVTNRGPGTASSITVTDALPASVTFVTASEECTNIAGLVVCDLGSLNSGTATNITLVVVPTLEGSLTNVAEVAATESDPNLTNNVAAAVTKVMAVPPPIPHDLAVVKLKAPKRIVLTTKAPTKVGKFTVTILNQSSQTEVISNLATLIQLVMVEVESLGTNCSSVAATLMPPKKTYPISLAPNKKLTLAFQTTFNCANDRLATTKTAAHNDYSTVAAVDLSALNETDTTDSNDVCPRPPNPAIGDPGCGNKTAAGTLGADVLTDVVVK